MTSGVDGDRRRSERRTRRTRIVCIAACIWILLLAASWIVQARSVRASTLPTTDGIAGAPHDDDASVERVAPGRLRVRVPRFDATGPATGERAGPAFIDVRTYGSDDAEVVVVALHGSPSGGGDFGELAAALEGAFGRPIRVIAPVCPGFGDSERWVPDYGARAQARIALGVMEALDVERAHVVGHSFGGATGLRMIEFAPHRVLSFTSYGGIGLQEAEGSGDYHFEHLKYRLGWATIVALPEAIPHFGALGDRADRHAFIRNFMDLDQRPLRGVLEGIDARGGPPILWLHGVEDPLVPVRAARLHHEFVRDSELVVFDRSHFMLFDERGAAALAGEIAPFVARHDDPLVPPERRTVDPFADDVPPMPTLPGGFTIEPGGGAWWQFGAIVLGTFVLEDPTAVTVGLLIRRGGLDPFLGIFATITGIFVGDLGLYGLGRLLASGAIAWPPLRRRLPHARLERLARWLDRRGWMAIAASRMLPGARVPLYVAAGFVRSSVWRFGLWTLIAVAIWTPILVLGSAIVGGSLLNVFERIFGDTIFAWIAVIVLLVIVWHLVLSVLTSEGRARLARRLGRARRWEFWPAWAIYAPLLPWLVWRAARVGGWRTITAVDPVWPDGGFIGESKAAVLERTPSEVTARTVLVRRGDVERRARAIETFCPDGTDASWPLIVKPDAGQRGEGVRVVSDRAALERTLDEAGVDLLVQARASGSCELGLFWWREPGAERGTLYSICEKVFPVVVGDGVRSIRALVAADSRLRLQEPVFRVRFGEEFDRVPTDGERVRLAKAGNHAQGALFRDGESYRTPALEAWCELALGSIEGWSYGRVDAIFEDADAARAGRDGVLIELNGVTSESTNMYDPTCAFLAGQRILRAHWGAALRIGRANRDRGVEGVGVIEIARRWWRFRRTQRDARVSD